MQSHIESMVLCLISTCVVGFKVLQNFYANCGESVYNLCRVKSNRLAVLTVVSGLDPHMIIKLEDDLNRCFIYDVDDGYFIYLFVG